MPWCAAPAEGGTGRGVAELEGPPAGAYCLRRRAQSTPERGPGTRVQGLQFEEETFGRDERRPAGGEFGCLALVGPGGGEVLGDCEQPCTLRAGGDVGRPIATARLGQQPGEEALHGEHAGGDGRIVDGQATRLAVAAAVHTHDAGGGLHGGLVGDPGPEEAHVARA